MVNSQSTMAKQNILSMSIGIGIGVFCLMSYVSGLPMDVPRYSQLGASPAQYNNSRVQARNNTYVETTDRLGAKPTTTTTAPPTPAPQFEYALLGQDPEDQRWYRVSLTPTGSKQTGYRAQFATRTSPPFDAQMAHKHDKTIKELLDFLEKAEEHNLLKVYGQLVTSDDDEEAKIKREVDNELELEQEPEMETKKKLRIDGGRPLLIVGELPATSTPTTARNATDTSMVNNFVYFIKGLK